MQKSIKNFKSTPKRFQPGGLTILYEDHDILVVDKVNGMLTMGTDRIKENTAYFRLTEYVRKGNQKSKKRVFIVHRLDKETSGVIIFAKTEPAKRFLQDEWHKFQKIYYAVVHGTLPQKEGMISSYLAENSIHRMYSVTNPENGKLAKTGYKILRETENFSLLEIELITGKKHQIRVHFSEKGYPVAGDKLYGDNERGIKRMALHAGSLTIIHPHTKEPMTFESKSPTYFKTLMKK
jgi:RluA family pseudouridine synthase